MGQTLGALTFADMQNPERFTEQDLLQGQVLANQVAQALEHSHLLSEIQRLQRQYQVMGDALDDAIYTLDAQRRLIYCNTAMEGLTGYRREEWQGQPPTLFYAPEYWPMAAERHQRVLQGEPVAARVEAEIVRRDGQRVPVEFSTASVQMAGQVIRRVFVARDITVRRHIEQRQQHYIDRLRLMHDIDQALHTVQAPHLLAAVIFTSLQRVVPYGFGTVPLYEVTTRTVSYLSTAAYGEPMPFAVTAIMGRCR